jgi:hypothetical protein
VESLHKVAPENLPGDHKADKLGVGRNSLTCLAAAYDVSVLTFITPIADSIQALA